MPHPCALNPELEGCAELALQHAGDVSTTLAAGDEGALATIFAELVAQLRDIAVNVADKAGHWIETTEDFAVEQAPLLVKEILCFETTVSAFWMVVGLLLVGWAVFAYRWSKRGAERRLADIREYTALLKMEKREAGASYQDIGDCKDVVFSFAHYGIPISGAVGAIAGLILTLTHGFYLAQILIAPRLYLVKYFKYLAG